jgi:hypothetical protein
VIAGKSVVTVRAVCSAITQHEKKKPDIAVRPFFEAGVSDVPPRIPDRVGRGQEVLNFIAACLMLFTVAPVAASSSPKPKAPRRKPKAPRRWFTNEGPMMIERKGRWVDPICPGSFNSPARSRLAGAS